jgi:hypothetical protein
LNEQFSSVFTKENTSTIPNLGTSKTPDAPNIIVGKEGVLKLLLNLNPHKATGPDQLSTRFLKKMATSITPSLQNQLAFAQSFFSETMLFIRQYVVALKEFH